MVSPVSFCGARLFVLGWSVSICDALAASPKTTWVCLYHLRGGSLVPVVVSGLFCRLFVHAGFVRIRRRDAASSSPRLLAPTLTGLPFAAEQMEVSNLL